MTHTSARVWQWTGIMAILCLFGGAYWYFQVYAGVKTNALSPTGSLTSGLVGYWPFDRVSVIGTASLDRSTSKYNGSLSGGPTVTSGQIGQAVDFDGSDDSMVLGSTSYLNVNDTADLTISGWFYRDTATTNDIIVSKINGIGPGEKGYVVYLASDDYLNFKIGDGVQTYTVTALMTFVTPAWTHFAVVWDQDSAANTKIYINGQSVSTSTNGTISDIDDTSHTNTFRIGALNGGTDPFDGKLDEVRVYNRTLTANEVSTLYSFTGTGSEVNSSASQPQGTGRLDSGLAGYWPMDNGSGTSATDASTNGGTGTLANGPTWGTGQVGGAVTFDGVDDSISISDASPLRLPQGNKMSIGFWYNTSMTSGSGTIYNKTTSSPSTYAMNVIGGAGTHTLRTYYRSYNGSSFEGIDNVNIGSYSNNAWHHVLTTFDTSTGAFRAYVDGVLVSSATDVPNSDIAGSGNLIIGAATGQPFAGSVDEFRIYNRALSADEVTDLYRITTPTSVDTGLKGYWSFNGKDMSGTSAYDRSGAGNTGTISGAVVTPGKLGQALSFDGTDDYVLASSAPVTAAPLTACFWMYPTDVSTNYRIPWSMMKNAAPADGWYFGINSAAQLTFTAANANTYATTSAYTVTANNWIHVCGVEASSSSRLLYVNGALVGSDSTSKVPSGVNQMTIGDWKRSAHEYYFQGRVDEARVYNRALTAAEIQAQYAMGQSDEVNTGASQAQGTGRLDSGLAGYWKLDDGSGISATDSSTNGNTGTLIFGPTWGSGPVGGAIDMDGDNDYISMGDPASGVLDFGTDNFSVSFWMNGAGYTDQIGSRNTAVSKRADSSTNANGYTFLYPSTNLMEFHISNGSATYTAADNVATASDNQWHHYVGTRTGSTMNLYVDGSVVATTSGVTGSVSSSTSLQIGDSGTQGTRNSNALFDEVRIYNRSLSADEISQLYSLNAPTGTDTSLKGYWSFNGRDISGTSAYDRSGAGNTGTLSGPTVTPGKLGQGLLFDGSNDYINAGTNVNITEAITIAVWAKTNDTKRQCFVSNRGGGYAFMMQGSSNSYRLRFTYFGTADWDSSINAYSADNNWHYYVVTNDTVNTKFYIDGVLFSTTSGGSGFSSSDPLMIGDLPSVGGTEFNGSLDEARIYNRALTEAEIKSLYNASK